MATITKNGAKGHHKFTLEVVENSTSIADNTSSLSFAFKISSLGGGWDWYGWGSNISYTVTINGTKYTGTIPDYDGSSTVTLKSGSNIKIEHNTDGKKEISISFSVDDNANQYYTCGDASASGTMTLTDIPRYATSNQSFKSKTETTITMNWSSDSTIDYIWVSKDNGANWTGLDVTDGTSGSYTLNKLSANTTYKIKTRVRRKDSQLTTDSSSLDVTTYNYPHCTDSPNFTIGNTLTLTLYNPLSRSVTIKGYAKSDGSKIFEGTTSGTSASGFKDEYSVNLQYASIPNATSGKYKVDVIYGDVTKTRDNGNTYSIKGTEKPTVGSLSYKDNNKTTTDITGNNQRIIRNHSNLLFTIGTANAKNSAEISKYEITFGGITKSRTSSGDLDFGKINLSSNSTATLKVTDSRGLSSTKEITVTIDNWVLPTALISLNRKNNFYSETYLKVDGTMSYLNGKNAMTIQYQFKKVTVSSYSTLANLSDNVQATLDLDNNFQWNIKVIIKDKLGSTTYNLVLDRGMPLIFFDRLKTSVGINCIPKYEKTLEVNDARIQNYSSEEQAIGTWVDGKPLYRKVFYVASPTVETNGTYAYVTYDTAELNIDFGYIENAYLKDTNYTFTLPYTNSSGQMVKAYYNRTNEKIEIASNASTYSKQYCYIVLCYTKTTD